MYLPSSSAAPGTSSLRGWNEPTPPAITTAPASNTVRRAGHDAEAAVLLTLDLRDFLAEVQARAERPDLLEQPIGQLLARAHRHGGNVVDRLVGIQLDALAAGRLQRIDDVRLQTRAGPSSNTWNRPHGPAPTMTTSVWIGGRSNLSAESLWVAVDDTRRSP